MFRKAHIITFPALIAMALLLTGCPPSPEFTQWKRPSTSVEGVKAAMTGRLQKLSATRLLI
ncbi:hypothetical protein HBO00_28685 [Pseudomonas sp. WS 5407]|nr:hypothetical protein [Pseudomonas sp. WS 5407]